MNTTYTTNKDRDIAIVGMSVFCPAGETVEEFWQGIVSGGDFITEAPPDVIEAYHFNGEPNSRDRFYCSRGGFAHTLKLDPMRYGILPIAADGIDPDQLSSMACVEQALIDAGIFTKKTDVPLKKCSIIIGKGNFASLIALRSIEIVRFANQFTKLLKVALPDLTEDDLEKVRVAYQDQQGRYQADTAIGTMPNLVASLVANRYDMQGPAYTVDAACASGIVAINHSIALLRSGECDLAVAGGMHVGQSAMFWGAFDIMGAMSRRQQIAPFSKDADGLLVGQGGGFIVLKTLSRAEADGDRIYAVIKDTAVSSDGAGTHVTVTSVAGQVRVLEKTWNAAGMDPKEIGYIEAHGTATPVGDRTEIATLKEFFGDNTHPRAFVGSVKSNIGHTMPAAGMIGVIKTALALYHRTIPPTLHCEEPLPSMLESRFMPPQEAIEWDSEKYPLIAGVNAFGFGGINAHAILTAYEPEPDAPPQPKPLPYRGETLLVSATSKESLINKLETGDFSNTGGDYRIVIFDPSEERVKQAVTIVEKDVPWRGRLDIWFSNRPLLTQGGKVVFMLAGFGPNQLSETDSLSEALDLPYLRSVLGEDHDDESLFSARPFITAHLCKEALTKLDVQPDMYIGHSLGEWYASTYAGISGGDWERVLDHVTAVEDPKTYPILAISGANCRVVESWCAELENVYVSNDNCPSQILVSGEPDGIETLQKRLTDEGLFYTKLPDAFGFHTPLVHKSIEVSQDLAGHFTIKPGDVPVWSGTTLEMVPTEEEAYFELVGAQMTRPVYFRELIEKLYDEQDARVFIQVGLGALVGFVEDTLKGREFSAITSAIPSRDGMEQLRRVLAALFIEGKEVDADFLGVKLMYQVDHSLMVLKRGAPILLTDLPELREVVQERYGSSGSNLNIGLAASDVSDATAHPLARAVGENVHEALKTQNEIFDLFERSGLTSSTAMDLVATASMQGAAQGLPEDFVQPLRLSFKDHPYLVDHSIVRQPVGWEHQEDLNLVVPFTMTIELLSEIALSHAPGRRLSKVSKVSAFRWIGLEQPFEETLKGTWKDADTLELNLEGYAQAEFTFADTPPAPPAEYVGAIDIGPEITEKPLTAEEAYDLYSFHGPQYHSDIEMLKVCARGIANMTMKAAGKGSMLDIMGQQLGLFLHLTQTQNTISFPVRLKELTFYGDIFDQEGIFEHTLVITRLTDSVIAGDMVFKRNGEIWAVARDFVCQRFQNYLPVWAVILKPQTNLLANEIAPGVFHYSNTNQDNVLVLLEKRYLNHWDRAELSPDLSKERWREHLTSRIALKDAVRSYVRQADDDMAYPIEMSCAHDDNGKPLLIGHDRLAGTIENLCVSLSHKGNEAVAIVSTTPVGIDIEKIEHKDESFWKAAFTPAEHALLKDAPQPETAIRFWVAKEAYAKKTGQGLITDPKRLEVTAINADILIIGKERIQTQKIGDNYLAGWTL